MCDEYTPCFCLYPKQRNVKPLTLLLLDCWQREYDVRPYRNFVFKRIDFENRMERNFHMVKDFMVITQFLQYRSLCAAHISGLELWLHEEDLMQCFVNGLRRIRSIQLKHMTLPTRSFEMLAANVSNMIVRELSFAGTMLNKEELTFLRTFIIKSQTLQRLDVSHCSISQYHFAILADGVHKSSSIRSFNCSRLMGDKLSLDHSKIAHIVAQLLWQNKLEELIMERCEFISHDLEIISEYLFNKSSKLVKLYLGYNLMATDGAEHLFRAISHSSTLTHLDIKGNGLGSHGGEVVARYLGFCYRLEYLDISYNGIGCEAMNSILTAMNKSIRISQIKVYGNKFNSKSANILRRLLDARVVPQDIIDITVIFDETLNDYRIIPYL